MRSNFGDENNGIYGRVSRYVPSYAVRDGAQVHISETYVASPPAAHIDDLYGAVWCLGYSCGIKGRSPKGQFCYNVLRNGRETGEMASVIEIKLGVVYIYTELGMKRWTGHSFIPVPRIFNSIKLERS